MTTTALPPRNRTRTPAARTPTAVPTPASHCVGIVTAVEQARYTVTSGTLVASARRASSCLLEVAPGDTVACLQVAPDELWILAILQREEGVSTVLRCQGDTRFEVQDGALSFHAPTLHLESLKMQIDTHDAEITTERARLVGRELTLVGTAIKAIGSALHTVFDRVSHFSKQHQRRTDGLDRVSATHLERRADQLLQLSGEHALINGDKLVKTRGSQIHFG